MAFIGCEKKPVDDGKEPDIPEPEQKYERYVKGQNFRSDLLEELVSYSLFMPSDYEKNTDKTYPVVVKVEDFKMPFDYITRKYEIFSKYCIESGEHTLKLVLNNPHRDFALNATNMVIYDNE